MIIKYFYNYNAVLIKKKYDFIKITRYSVLCVLVKVLGFD